NPAISRDGSRIAVSIGLPGQRDIWIADVKRGNSTRFTFDPGSDDFPAWSPDDKTITFSSFRNNQFDIYSGPADSPGQGRLLLHKEEPKTELHWTKDGRFLLFSSGTQPGRDIWALPVESDGKPGNAKAQILVQTPFDERLPRVSPNGRWLAY